MTLSRRDFVKQSAALALTAGTAAIPSWSLADKETPPNLLPIIDTHQHLWDLSKFQPPWLKDAPEILARSYVTKDFVAATAGLNVVKAVYMEVDVDPAQQVAEAEHVIELSRSGQHPTVAAVISGRPNSAGFAAYIKRFEGNPYIKGVRQVLHAPEAARGLCLEPQFVSSIRLLGELGLSFDLCMRPTELGDGAKLVDQCPDTRFIVDHCGNADPKAFLPVLDEQPWHEADAWRRDLAELAKRDNVICKVSGIVARVPKTSWTAEILAPIINHCLDTFGPERVVFGGDWPVCLLGATYRRWVESLKAVIHSRPEAEQRKLLHDNAERIYALQR